jgi:hypothetical protein
MESTIYSLETWASGIIASIIASLFMILINLLYRFWKDYRRNKKFKNIFGNLINEKLYLVLPSLSLRADVEQFLANNQKENMSFPLINSSGNYIRLSKLIALADTVALKYILDLSSKILGNKSIILTDSELDKKLDISFVSFGGSSFYSAYVLAQSDNQFYSIDFNSIISIQDPSTKFSLDHTYDYGFIIKYKHVNFPNKTWIIIAGIGESGTRGASYFLYQNWKTLARDFKNNCFGIVVRVNHGIDHSAIEVNRTIVY